ncbi:hypothetical protein [Pedobacter sp. JY14-1]|uniref:hypothetical protein n=1 Tax=Pedobacter sp. JY14-1 TaxID=3034151 RepID=UPI0023E30651|nr:hypothetical protein [Pedobacter sp. JY14-1]
MKAIAWLTPAPILLLFFCNSLYAQQPSGTGIQENEKPTLTLAALYSNNVNYYGQSTAERLPYVLANATLRLPSGLYFSAGGYQLLNVGGGLSETDLGLGYDHDFNEHFSAGLAYTRSFFPKNSPLLQASNPNNISLSSSYNWAWSKSVLSADYAFGEENDLFLTITQSKDIELGTLFSSEDMISVEPAIEFVGGTQHFLTTYQREKEKRNNGKGQGSNKPATETITESHTSFNMLSYNFRIPVSYSRASYMAEAGYQFSVIGRDAATETKRYQHYLNLAFYYQF